MDVEKACKIAEAAVLEEKGKKLNYVQVMVLKGSCQDMTYEQMAKDQYSAEYLKKKVGYKLWKLLSEVFEEKVNKKNVWEVLRRRMQDESGPVLDTPASESETIYKELLRLDYFEQVKVFRKFVETHPVGTCLVHGDEEHGQRWLVNRLVQLVPNGIAAKVIPFGLGRKSRANYINALWRELGGRVGLSGLPTLTQIAEAVCKWWQTQSVILIFYDVDQMPKDYMHAFIRDFWLPVANLACDRPQPSRKLLMFLVAHTGAVEQWGVNFAETLENWQPQIPLKLPRIDRLDDRDLISWMENSLNELPPKLTSEIDSTVRDILDNSDNGVPQLVLEHICFLCGCNWYDEEQKWLKH